MPQDEGARDQWAAGEVDVEDLIDSQNVTRQHIRLLLICATVLFLDGFDAQAMGYVAPAVAGDLKLSKQTLGPVFSSGLIGLMVGALLFGPVADRFGRKPIILASTILFGLGSLATVLAHDAEALMWMRVLTGIGLGGAMPNTVALMAELSPKRRRATMVMAMFCGFSIGAALGGLIAAALIPALGWRSVFAAGGAAPLLYAPFLARLLPESPRFLALRGGQDDRVSAVLISFFPEAAMPVDTRFAVHQHRLKGLPIVHLFGNGRGAGTVLIWVIFFASLLDLYFLSSWLPTVLNDRGASVSLAAMIGAMFQIGGVAGTFALGNAIDRFSFTALSLSYLLAGIAVAGIGLSVHSTALVTLFIFLAGFCIVGGQTAANALASGFYVTSIRSTGVGWALGIGRTGAILGPLLGGVLLSLKLDTTSLFFLAAVPPACGASAAFVLSRIERAKRVR
jgi:AAHS family 4-hydroxybenzoate transporter-like MFS transporter